MRAILRSVVMVAALAAVLPPPSGASDVECTVTAGCDGVCMWDSSVQQGLTVTECCQDQVVDGEVKRICWSRFRWYCCDWEPVDHGGGGVPVG